LLVHEVSQGIVADSSILKPEDRLGYGRDGIEKIKSHPFFADIDWDQLARQDVKPPFMPITKDTEDVSNFDPLFT